MQKSAPNGYGFSKLCIGDFFRTYETVGVPRNYHRYDKPHFYPSLDVISSISYDETNQRPCTYPFAN